MRTNTLGTLLILGTLATGLAAREASEPREGPDPRPAPGPSPTPSPSPTPTPSPSPTPSPEPSPPAEGASRAFATEITRLSDQADVVDRLWQMYKGGCQPQVGMGYDFGREWFALWDRAFVPRSQNAECGELLQRVVAQGGTILKSLTAADSAARRSQVAPATLQGMLRWHGLEWWPLNATAQQRASIP